jgi:hypothetical protein
MALLLKMSWHFRDIFLCMIDITCKHRLYQEAVSVLPTYDRALDINRFHLSKSRLWRLTLAYEVTQRHLHEGAVVEKRLIVT